MKPISELQVAERPRERCLAHGAISLSDEELLAIVLGSGTRGHGVTSLASKILRILDEVGLEITPAELEEIPGVGRAKSLLIVAALELARRRIRPKGLKVRCAADVMQLVSHWARREKEHFIAITLNGAHEVIETRVVTIGLVNSSQVHPREVFADAIADRACAVILAHNHPSGNLVPSKEDERVTQVLADAGRLLGIKVLDHIIFSAEKIFSFAEQNLLPRDA